MIQQLNLVLTHVKLAGSTAPFPFGSEITIVDKDGNTVATGLLQEVEQPYSEFADTTIYQPHKLTPEKYQLPKMFLGQLPLTDEDLIPDVDAGGIVAIVPSTPGSITVDQLKEEIDKFKATNPDPPSIMEQVIATQKALFSPPATSTTVGLTDKVISQFSKAIGPAIGTYVTCPGEKCAACSPGECPDGCQFKQNPLPLYKIIIHLNDDHAWERERIADWLETLDLDLSFKPTEGEPNGNQD